MKKIFLLSIFVLIASLAFSQRVIRGSKVITGQFQLNGFTITQIESDTLLSSELDTAVPTSRAVKKYIDIRDNKFRGYVNEAVDLDTVTSPVSGDIAFDSTDQVLYIRTADMWQNIDVGGGGTESDNLTTVIQNDTVIVDTSYIQPLRIISDDSKFAALKAPIGSIILNEATGAYYKNTVDSIVGIVVGGPEVKQTALGYAVIEKWDTDLRAWGVDLTDTLSDQAGLEKLINFNRIQNGGIKQKIDAGLIKLDTVLFSGQALDFVELIGDNTKIEYTSPEIYSFKVFDIQANNVKIEGFNITSNFDELKTTISSPIATDPVAQWLCAIPTHCDTGNDTLYLLSSGFANANFSYSPINVGTVYRVVINAPRVSGVVTFGVEDNPTVQLSSGINEFDYEVTTTASPERFELVAGGSANADITSISISTVTTYTIPQIDDGTDYVIEVQARNQSGANSCEIVNNIINTGEQAIYVNENISNAFSHVNIEGNEVKARTAIQVVGDHRNVNIRNNYCEKHRKWDGEDGIKLISYSNDTSVEGRSHVNIVGNSTRYGGDGSQFFVSGAIGVFNFDGNSVFDFNYYLNSDGNKIAYEKTSTATDPNRLEHNGGNIIKLDPVFYDPARIYSINNLYVTGTNDTSDIFQPLVFAGNGTVGINISNSNFDIGQIALNELDYPAIGGAGGSESGRILITDCIYNRSTGEPLVLSEKTNAKGLVIYDDPPLFGTGTDSSRYAIMNEYTDSLAEYNAGLGVFCLGCTMSDVESYGAAIVVSERNVNLDNVKVYGPARIELLRDETVPFNDTLNWVFNNVDAVFGLDFRSTDGNDGSGDINTNITFNNSEITLYNTGGVSGDVQAYLESLPNLYISGTKLVEREIVPSTAFNNTYLYRKTGNDVEWMDSYSFLFQNDGDGTASTASGIGRVDFLDTIAVARDHGLQIGATGDTPTGVIKYELSSNYLKGYGTADWNIGSETNGIAFHVDNNNRNIGIRTAIPSEALEVNGNAKVDSVFIDGANYGRVGTDAEGKLIKKPFANFATATVGTYNAVEDNTAIYISASGGATTVNLLQGSEMGGRTITLIRLDNNPGTTITVTASSGNIFGSAGVGAELANQYSTVTLLSDGASYYVTAINTN